MWAIWARLVSVAIVVLLATIAMEGWILIGEVRGVAGSVEVAQRYACGGADDPCIVQPHRAGFEVEVIEAPTPPVACGGILDPCYVIVR